MVSPAITGSSNIVQARTDENKDRVIDNKNIVWNGYLISKQNYISALCNFKDVICEGSFNTSNFGKIAYLIRGEPELITSMSIINNWNCAKKFCDFFNGYQIPVLQSQIDQNISNDTLNDSIVNLFTSNQSENCNSFEITFFSETMPASIQIGCTNESRFGMTCSNLFQISQNNYTDCIAKKSDMNPAIIYPLCLGIPLIWLISLVFCMHFNRKRITNEQQQGAVIEEL